MRFVQYIAFRLLGVIATTIVGATIVFFVMHAVPGDPAQVALGQYATPKTVATFRAQHHLNDPVAVQYFYWLQGLATGTFGKSLTLSGGVPISELVKARLPNTMFIGFYALVIALAVALTMGTLAALRRGKATDAVATSLAAVGISMPDFWLSFVLILFFALTLGWLPGFGFINPFDSIGGALISGLLPATAMAAPMAAIFSRSLRAALLENTQREYVTVARSLGFSSQFIFIHYIFRNSLIPLIVIVGLQIRYLVGGVVVIEKVFGIPGIGSLMVDAAFARDFPVVQACTVIFLVIVLLVNFLVDVICAMLDPKRT